jgi:hypothetical protein
LQHRLLRLEPFLYVAKGKPCDFSFKKRSGQAVSLTIGEIVRRLHQQQFEAISNDQDGERECDSQRRQIQDEKTIQREIRACESGRPDKERIKPTRGAHRPKDRRDGPRFAWILGSGCDQREHNKMQKKPI